MRIAVSADTGGGLDSPVSPHFGRCPYYVLVDLDDRDVLKIPQVLTDPYGRFIAGQNGYAQLLAVDPQGQPITVEGTADGSQADGWHRAGEAYHGVLEGN